MVHSAARAFLSQCAGLTYLQRSPYRSDSLMAHIDPVEAADRISRAEVAVLEMAEVVHLAPIGMCGYGEFVVMMDEDGRVYGVHERSRRLLEWGESGEGWLETLRVPSGPQARYHALPWWRSRSPKAR